MKIVYLFSDQPGIRNILESSGFLELFDMNSESDFDKINIFALSLVEPYKFTAFDQSKNYANPLFIVVNSTTRVDEFKNIFLNYFSKHNTIISFIHDNMNKKLKNYIIKSFCYEKRSYHEVSEKSCFYNIYKTLLDIKSSQSFNEKEDKVLIYKDKPIPSYDKLFEILLEEVQLYNEHNQAVSEVINDMLNLSISMNKIELIKRIKSNVLLKSLKIDKEGKSEILLSEYIQGLKNYEDFNEIILRVQNVFKGKEMYN